jgi:ribosome-associated heat shock protein Hsp15
MRIDQLLNKLCLVKTRSIAKKACDKNLVKINDKIAKASASVHDEDIIEYQLYGYFNKLRITTVPKGNVSKNNAPEFYKILERKKLEIK